MMRKLKTGLLLALAVQACGATPGRNGQVAAQSQTGQAAPTGEIEIDRIEPYRGAGGEPELRVDASTTLVCPGGHWWYYGSELGRGRRLARPVIAWVQPQPEEDERQAIWVRCSPVGDSVHVDYVVPGYLTARATSSPARGTPGGQGASLSIADSSWVEIEVDWSADRGADWVDLGVFDATGVLERPAFRPSSPHTFRVRRGAAPSEAFLVLRHWRAGGVLIASDTLAVVTIPAARVVASAELPGASGTPGATVGGGLHEPDGFTPVVERAFDAVEENGFVKQIQNRNTSIVKDPTAPASPPNVQRQFWPRGCEAGHACGNWIDRYTFSPVGREMYVRFFFQYSPDWQGHEGSCVNKLFYLSVASYPGDKISIATCGQGQGPLRFRPTLQSQNHRPCGIDDRARNLQPNTGGRALLERGQWYEIEMYFRMNSRTGDQRRAPCDGVFRAWIDGVLTHDYSPERSGGAENRGVVYVDQTDPAEMFNFATVKLHPIWGGGASSRARRDMWILFDHLYISTRR